MISNIICFLIGKTGSGKSTLLNYLIKREYKLKRREGIVVLDLRADHLNLLKECEDFHYLPFYGQFLKYKINWAEYFKKYPFVIIEPIQVSREEYELLADEIAEGILAVKNRVFVLEEAGLAFPVLSSVRRNLSVLITTGRKLGIDLYFTSQRPSFVNTLVVSQANIRIAFLLTDKNDLQRAQPYFAKTDLSKLKRFEFVAINDFTHKEVKGSTSNPEILDKIF